MPALCRDFHGMLGAVNAQTLAELQQSSFNRAGKATSSSYPPQRRMSGEVLHSFLSARRYIVVATTRASGFPHISLMPRRNGGLPPQIRADAHSR
jgi:hypothetical protein